MELLISLLVLIGLVALFSMRQVNQYERGIKFKRGKFYKIIEPGWHVIWPIFESMTKVDIRTKVDDVPEQEAITKDNVSVKINAVIYYKIFDASLAVLEVENFRYATAQLAQTTMRNVVGSVSLDELLSERDAISTKIKEVIDKETDPWGIKVENVELKDISLTEEMKRVIARAAEAEREKQAVITKSIGEKEAANNLANAAKTLAQAPGALHLRTLETINDVSSDQSNTIFFAMPIELLEAIKGYADKKR
jgi:regulator of protease activity HflC (stomatin/prohibitin superfamily)